MYSYNILSFEANFSFFSLAESPPCKLPINKKVSMELTDRSKTAKNLADSRKN